MKPTDPPSRDASARQGPPPPEASAGQAPPSRNAGDRGAIVHHHTPEELHNDDVAHEHSDINIRAIVWSAVVLTVVCVGTAILMALLFRLLEDQAAASDPKLSPLAMPATTMPPTTTSSPTFGAAPQPQLLTNEPAFLMQLRDRERQQLGGYGWVDEKAGVARIPIDEAKKVLVERGLSARPDAPADPRLGTHAAAFGESSSGRTVTRVSTNPRQQRQAPAVSPKH